MVFASDCTMIKKQCLVISGLVNRSQVTRLICIRHLCRQGVSQKPVKTIVILNQIHPGSRLGRISCYHGFASWNALSAYIFLAVIWPAGPSVSFVRLSQLRAADFLFFPSLREIIYMGPPAQPLCEPLFRFPILTRQMTTNPALSFPTSAYSTLKGHPLRYENLQTLLQKQNSSIQKAPKSREKSRKFKRIVICCDGV